MRHIGGTLTIAFLLAFSAEAATAPLEGPDGVSEKTAPHAQQEHAPAHRDNREISGTAWQPAATPMYAHHLSRGSWSGMIHYAVFATYDYQDGPRGEEQLGSTNWIMVEAKRPHRDGRLMLRGMWSLDYLTTAGDGYPLLFQTGESWGGEPLVDRQHPHDLFMELAARYDHAAGGERRWFIYLAPVGEPALGPVAYPHRLSALEFPLAPLGHHWQDSTHITFGVVTAGLYATKWQSEISYFTGREPDEKRTDLDPIRLDSVSARLTYNPSSRWSLSGSYGDVASPEALHPGEDLVRRVISGSFFQRFGAEEFLAATAVWGRNNIGSEHTDSYLLEGNFTARRHHLFARLESVSKTGEELNLAPAEQVYRVNAATLGYVYDVWQGEQDVGIGIGVFLPRSPNGLRNVYGDELVSYLVYLRVRPGRVGNEGIAVP